MTIEAAAAAAWTAPHNKNPVLRDYPRMRIERLIAAMQRAGWTVEFPALENTRTYVVRLSNAFGGTKLVQFEQRWSPNIGDSLEFALDSFKRQLIDEP